MMGGLATMLILTLIIAPVAYVSYRAIGFDRRRQPHPRLGGIGQMNAASDSGDGR